MYNASQRLPRSWCLWPNKIATPLLDPGLPSTPHRFSQEKALLPSLNSSMHEVALCNSSCCHWPGLPVEPGMHTAACHSSHVLDNFVFSIPTQNAPRNTHGMWNKNSCLAATHPAKSLTEQSQNSNLSDQGREAVETSESVVAL